MPHSRRRYILHADLDAFFASVEQLDNPELRGRPVVVGAAAEARGVVAAASYEARKFGIRSAMPMRTAIRLCPDLVRVPPRFDRYREMSRQVMSIFRRLTPLVEPLSLDEAYLDVSSQTQPDTVDAVARDLKQAVRQETGLTVTIGGGTGKTVAKIASQVAKPDGLLLIRPGEEATFLAPLDVELLWGVGPKTAEVLRARGVRTIGDLAGWDEARLGGLFGRRGPELVERARGIDPSAVVTSRETKSVSAETTMARDVGDEATLAEQVERLAGRVARRLREKGLRGRTIDIKLRLSDFTTLTRQTTLSVPTDDADAVASVARSLLRRELKPGRRFRLVGVGVSNLQPRLQLPLLPPE